MERSAFSAIFLCVKCTTNFLTRNTMPLIETYQVNTRGKRGREGGEGEGKGSQEGRKGKGEKKGKGGGKGKEK